MDDIHSFKYCEDDHQLLYFKKATVKWTETNVEWVKTKIENDGYLHHILRLGVGLTCLTMTNFFSEDGLSLWKFQ
jgi:hypothetical protein